MDETGAGGDPSRTRRSDRGAPAALLTAGRGVLMGLADVVPGVSGGTVALILGIYARLIRAIRRIDLALAAALWAGVTRGRAGRRRLSHALREADVAFLLLLGTGIATAILLAAHALTRLMADRPVLLLAFFLGLILASAWIPYRMVDPVARHRTTTIAVGLAGAVLAWLVAGMTALGAPTGAWFVPVAGAIAICAMILPGISGAFLLLMMGMYERMLHALSDRDVLVVGLFLAGAAAGLLAFSRLLDHLLTRRRNHTLAFLTGLMLGSLRKLWPFKDQYDEAFASGRNVLPDAWTMDVTAAALAFLAGMLLVMVLHLAVTRRERATPPKGPTAP